MWIMHVEPLYIERMNFLTFMQRQRKGHELFEEQKLSALHC